MEAKVLWFVYDDSSHSKVVRVYLEDKFEQAEKDFEMMQEYASTDKNWKLEDIDLCTNESLSKKSDVSPIKDEFEFVINDDSYYYDVVFKNLDGNAQYVPIQGKMNAMCYVAECMDTIIQKSLSVQIIKKV